MKTYKLELTEQQLQTIVRLIYEFPMSRKVSDELLTVLQKQVTEQQDNVLHQMPPVEQAHE